MQKVELKTDLTLERLSCGLHWVECLVLGQVT